MKKIILIFILLNAFSCNNYDLEITKEEEENQILQKKGGFIVLNNGGKDGTLIDNSIADKLDIYAYVIGRVLLKNNSARNQIVNNISSNNTLDLNITLYNNMIIRTAFITELDELVFSEFGDLLVYRPNNSQTFRIKPPLTTKKPGLITYSLASTIENEILTNTFANHFEMYIPNTLTFSNNTSGNFLSDNNGNQYSNFDTVYTGYSPIYNPTAITTGYSLTFAIEINGGIAYDRGSEETYNTVTSQSGNVIIVREL